MAENIEKLLLKTKEQTNATDQTNDDILRFSKQKIKRICKALCLPSKDYDPKKTIEAIKTYLQEKNIKGRILYSEISSIVYNLEEDQQGNFATNIESLLSFSLNDNNQVCEEHCKIIVKIYDHFQLALNQKSLNSNTKEVIKKHLVSSMESAKQSIEEDLREDVKLVKETIAEELRKDVESAKESIAEDLREDVKSAKESITEDLREDVKLVKETIAEELRKDVESAKESIAEDLRENVKSAKESIAEELKEDVKHVEREYISILGIFASIVFAFIGGVTFSTSVLQNINAISIYRLILITDLLALVLSNTVCILMKFICTINNKDKNIPNMKRFNIILIAIGILVVIAWIIDIKALAIFIEQHLPWIKQ